jgi:hypothetical protein
LQELVFPCTVKSTSSFKSSDCSFSTLRSELACSRRAWSSASSSAASPQEQSLQGRRRFFCVSGWQFSAVIALGMMKNIQMFREKEREHSRC